MNTHTHTHTHTHTCTHAFLCAKYAHVHMAEDTDTYMLTIDEMELYINQISALYTRLQV